MAALQSLALHGRGPTQGLDTSLLRSEVCEQSPPLEVGEEGRSGLELVGVAVVLVGDLAQEGDLSRFAQRHKAGSVQSARALLDPRQTAEKGELIGGLPEREIEVDPLRYTGVDSTRGFCARQDEVAESRRQSGLLTSEEARLPGDVICCGARRHGTETRNGDQRRGSSHGRSGYGGSADQQPATREGCAIELLGGARGRLVRGQLFEGRGRQVSLLHCPLLYANSPCRNCSTRYSLDRRARDIMVRVGFTHPMLT